MKNNIVKFDKTNSSIVRDGNAKCDRCGKTELTETFSILNRIGDDVDVFEFENGIWSVCVDCKAHYENIFAKVKNNA